MIAAVFREILSICSLLFDNTLVVIHIRRTGLTNPL